MAPMVDPAPGLVIRYACLWKSEAAQGRHEGSKDRPGVVVLAVTDYERGDKTVWVAPITHGQPDDASAAVEMPPATGRRLGLDEDRSWIVVSEVNRFVWLGPDLRPVASSRWAYGLWPAGLFRVVRDRLPDLAGRHRLARVRRDP